MGIPNSWMVQKLENHIKLDDLGVPLCNIQGTWVQFQSN